MSENVPVWSSGGALLMARTWRRGAGRAAAAIEVTGWELGKAIRKAIGERWRCRVFAIGERWRCHQGAAVRIKFLLLIIKNQFQFN